MSLRAPAVSVHTATSSILAGAEQAKVCLPRLGGPLPAAKWSYPKACVVSRPPDALKQTLKFLLAVFYFLRSLTKKLYDYPCHKGKRLVSLIFMMQC